MHQHGRGARRLFLTCNSLDLDGAPDQQMKQLDGDGDVNVATSKKLGSQHAGSGDPLAAISFFAEKLSTL